MPAHKISFFSGASCVCVWLYFATLVYSIALNLSFSRSSSKWHYHHQHEAIFLKPHQIPHLIQDAIVTTRIMKHFLDSGIPLNLYMSNICWVGVVDPKSNKVTSNNSKWFRNFRFQTRHEVDQADTQSPCASRPIPRLNNDMTCMEKKHMFETSGVATFPSLRWLVEMDDL